MVISYYEGGKVEVGEESGRHCQRAVGDRRWLARNGGKKVWRNFGEDVAKMAGRNGPLVPEHVEDVDVPDRPR